MHIPSLRPSSLCGIAVCGACAFPVHVLLPGTTSTIGCCIFLHTGRWPLHSPSKHCLSIRRPIYLKKMRWLQRLEYGYCRLYFRSSHESSRGTCIGTKKSGATTAGSNDNLCLYVHEVRAEFMRWILGCRFLLPVTIRTASDEGNKQYVMMIHHL